MLIGRCLQLINWLDQTIRMPNYRAKRPNKCRRKWLALYWLASP
jgi:hypothetical protein